MGVLGNVFITLLTGAIGGIIGLVGVGYLRTYVRLKRSDPVDVRTLDDPSLSGSVELAGTARVHEETARSPFTDSECLVHRWRAERYSPGGKGSNWHRIDSGGVEHPFLLADDSGSALVDPAGASLEMTESEEIDVDDDEEPPPTVAAFLEQHDRIDASRDRRRRFTESRLEPGDDVHVLGPVRETGHTVDMPGGVDAVVGVEDPGERGFTVGEDDLSDLLAQVRTDPDQFTVSNMGEASAERHMLKQGILLTAFGATFAGIPFAFVWLL